MNSRNELRGAVRHSSPDGVNVLCMASPASIAFCCSHASGTPRLPTVSHTPMKRTRGSVLCVSRNAWASGESAVSSRLRQIEHACWMSSRVGDFSTPHFRTRPTRLRAVYAPRLKPRTKISSFSA